MLQRLRRRDRRRVGRGRRHAGARRRQAGHRRPRRELLPQQLEVNHHRVQRVLHLVRDARREAAERGQLARVADGGLHLAEVLEIAGDEHDADQSAGGIVNRVRHDQVLDRLAVVGLTPVQRHRPARLAAHERLLDQLLSGVLGRYHRFQRGADRSARQQCAHGRIQEHQLVPRIDDGDGVLEVFDGRLEMRHLPGHLRAVRRQLRADGIEEVAQLAELVLLIEVEPDAELARPEAGETAANHVDRSQQELRQEHRDPERDSKRDDGRDKGGPERLDQAVANQQRRNTHPDGAEFGIAAQQGVLQHERLALARVNRQQLNERRPFEEFREIVAFRQRPPLERPIHMNDGRAVDVGDGGEDEVFVIETRLEDRSQSGVVAQRFPEIAVIGHLAGAVKDCIGQLLGTAAAFLEQDAGQGGQVQDADADDHHGDERGDAEDLLALDA